MALQADDILDLIATTQKHLGELKWTDLTGDLQNYIMLPQLFKEKKVGFTGGQGIQFNIMKSTSGAAKMTGLFAVDAVNIGDVMTTGTIPWRHATTNYGIERREISMNKEPQKIVDLVKVRRADAMISLNDLMETQGWSKPADSTDTDNAFGIPYWAVKNATEGFYGGNPAGFTSGAANVSSTTVPRWKNWSGTFTDISKEDLVRKMRKASMKTKFVSPIAISQYNTGNDFGYYTTYAVVGLMEEMLEDQNDNLGPDIAKYDGAVLFKKNPVINVPWLDENDATDPVYGLNWGVTKIVFLEGENMVETNIRPASNQHTTYTTHVDLSFNFLCYDRRRNFVLYKV